MTSLTPTETEMSDIQGRLHELMVEHRDLDMVIDHLELSPSADELLIRRLKKRKLQIKDRILQLEQLLVPDIPA